MIDDIQRQVVNLYRDAGCTSKDTVTSLAGIVGAAILAHKPEMNTVAYSNAKFAVKIQVVESY